MSKIQPLAEFLTITQAAQTLKVSRQAIAEAINRGRLPSTQLGHVRVISRQALAQYRKTRHPGGRPKTKPKDKY